MENEIAKYQHAVAVRDEQIRQLREDLAGEMEVERILHGYVGVLFGTGERRVSKKELHDAIQNFRVRMKDDGDDYIFTSTVEKERREEV